ncbi:MAG: CDP-diacylglycerol--glycerol-3-phosphate 3-phosphatidyltransferase [Deltaproteobacteria bacterium]|nr:CDP-diacylglycerol--glycerol-3-phosphate 3-phosphatidyltransferase [Deltaproteobacteria bacterium]
MKHAFTSKRSSAIKNGTETRVVDVTGRDGDFWNLPNALSLARLSVTPVLVVLLLSPGRKLSVATAALFLAVCLTDWLDGYIARRTGVETVIGKFLDPLADKILIVTALVMLIQLNRVPAWMVALIVARELSVTGLRAVAIKSGIVMPASRLGKAKTVAQICATAPLILHYPFFGIDFHEVGIAVLWAALFVTVWSGADYFVRFFRSPSSRG